jgi:CheY-like chemotaxis protein
MAPDKKTILIADDAEVFRRLEEGLLRVYGYDFLHASDGAQAVKQCVEHRPDLVLLDVQMPVMDGVQVLAVLKKDERTKDIPIVVVTTIGRQKDEEILMKGGADAFLTKPVRGTELVGTVRRLLGEVK